MTVNSSAREMTSSINVTPMIDVLLVLLIIFMVFVPALPRGESAQVQQPAREDGQSGKAVVLEIVSGSDGALHFAINQQRVNSKDLATRLAAIYANRAERVLFLKGDDRLSFTQVAEVIDLSHSVGVDRIGLLTPNVQAGR